MTIEFNFTDAQGNHDRMGAFNRVCVKISKDIENLELDCIEQYFG